MLSRDVYLNVGETAVLTCIHFGGPDGNIGWRFNGAPLTNTSLITVFNEEIVQGTGHYKQSFLQLCSIAMSSAGSYTCVVNNRLGTNTATTQLVVTSKFCDKFKVLSLFVLITAAEVVMTSKDVYLNEEETTVLVCMGRGEPYVEVHWTFNGMPVANTSLTYIFEEDVVLGGRHYKESYLQLCSLTTAISGSYSCTASNGVVVSNATTHLTVTG